VRACAAAAPPRAAAGGRRPAAAAHARGRRRRGERPLFCPCSPVRTRVKPTRLRGRRGDDANGWRRRRRREGGRRAAPRARAPPLSTSRGARRAPGSRAHSVAAPREAMVVQAPRRCFHPRFHAAAVLDCEGASCARPARRFTAPRGDQQP
jgi:hypothetical protein